MSRRTVIEIWVGFFTLITIVSLIVIAFKVSNFQISANQGTYQVHALFSNIGGLKEKSAVKISGVVVGRVASITIDKESFKARVTMEIYDSYNKLSLDTSGSILTSGLLGDQYIGLEPGADEEYLVDGDYLDIVQSALVIEELIGKFLTSFSEK
ncbi:MAG TPA: outer membrane lipid asymmetry maintenance protein MlaD [Thiomicrospira sp.]|nr:outer membrane lipid asymmetry maintenance protein MlaD [Thiomicrospira sp.]